MSETSTTEPDGSATTPTFSTNLRSEAAEMREHVSNMLDRLGGSSSLAVQIQAIAEAPDMPADARARLAEIAGAIGPKDETKPMIAAIAGAVTANVYDALADTVDYLTAKNSLKTVSDRIREDRKFNDALRMAAGAGFAGGNWDKFDDIVEEWFEKRHRDEGNDD